MIMKPQKGPKFLQILSHLKFYYGKKVFSPSLKVFQNSFAHSSGDPPEYYLMH